MYRDASRAWQYNYLIADVSSSVGGPPQRLVLIAPGTVAAAGAAT